MSLSKFAWWGGAALSLLILISGCDVPTGTPSVNTDVGVKTPLVADKTLTFLGGPKSRLDPLIDTTSSTFDSLFVVGEEPKDVSIQQTIDNFDIGALDNALDEAGGDLSITNSGFSTDLIESSSDLVNQKIEGSYMKANSPYQASDPDGSLGTSAPVADTDGDNVITVNFPAPGTDPGEVFELPDFGTVDATGSGASVDAVQLTDDRTAEGEQVNRIQFTLVNNGSNTLKGEDGSGAPHVRIQDTKGTVETLETASFNTSIPPGEEETTTLFVTGLVLDNTTQYQLLVSGTDASNEAELTVNLSKWRYQKAFLSNAQDVNIELQDGLSTRGAGASQFEGINAGGGSVALSIDNGFSFDLAVDPIQLRNAEEPSFGNLNALGIDLSFANPPIEGGTVARDTVNMGGRGISDTIDVSGAASPVSSDIVVSADDTLGVSTEGLINIQTLYFHPSGEGLSSRGTFSFDEERVTFEEGDYVEVSSITLDVSDLTFDPQVDVDTFSLIYPDIRLRDRDGDGRTYEPGFDDALRARFVENPSGKFEFDRRNLQQSSTGFQISFDNANVRIFAPGGNELEYEIRGLLEEGPDSDAIVSVDDQLSGSTTITDLTLEEIDVSGAEPFTVAVPTNDGDNELDIAEDDEVREASFEGFGGITDRVSGLQLANANLDFFLETKNLASTNAELYAAIQGQNDAGSIFLAGNGDNRGVSSVPFEKEFVEGDASIKPDSLIRLGVDLNDAQLGERLRQQETVNADNSNVADFINALPTQVRFLGQARLNKDGGDLKVRKPIEVDAGFTLEVPLQIRSEFVVRDTINADFSSLEDATDPSSTLTASDITFEFGYENGLPLGANAELTIADSSGAPIKTFSGDNLRIEPAPKNSEGAAEGTTGPQTAEFTLGGTLNEIRKLAAGREIRLRLAMTQASGDQPAQLRADDTIRFSLKLNANASVNTN